MTSSLSQGYELLQTIIHRTFKLLNYALFFGCIGGVVTEKHTRLQNGADEIMNWYALFCKHSG